MNIQNFFAHRRAQRLLSAYLDNELSSREREFVAGHIAECSACAQKLNQYKTISQRIQAWAEEPLTLDLENRMRNTYLGGAKKRSTMKKQTFIKYAAVMGVVVMAVLTTQVFLKRQYVGSLRSSGDLMETQLLPGKGAQTKVIEEKAEEKAYVYETTVSGGAVLGDTYDQRHTLEARTPRYTADVDDIGIVDKTKREGRKRAGAPARFIDGVELEKFKYGADEVSGKQKNTKKDGKCLASRVNDVFTDTHALPAAPISESPLRPEDEGFIVIRDVLLPATGDEEKIIRNANVHIEVSDAQKAYDEVARVSKEQGGYVATVDFSKESGSQAAARAVIVVRVPRKNLDETIEALKELGTVKGIDVQSVDVSRQYQKLTSEFNTTKAIYEKIVEKYKRQKSSNPDKAIDIEIQKVNALAPYERAMAEISGKIMEYDNRISMSTLTVRLTTENWQYEASIRAEVDDVQKAYDAAVIIAKENSGFVAGGDIKQENNIHLEAQITVKVPLEKADAAITQLKKLGSVKTFAVTHDLPESCVAAQEGNQKKFTCKGNAEITVSVYIPEWKAQWRASADDARAQLMQSVYAMMHGGIAYLPQIVLGVMLLGILIAVIATLVSALKKTPQRNTPSKEPEPENKE